MVMVGFELFWNSEKMGVGLVAVHRTSLGFFLTLCGQVQVSVMEIELEVVGCDSYVLCLAQAGVAPVFVGPGF